MPWEYFVFQSMELAMTREELLEDLAYARSLAEEGRQAPLLGGAHLCFWGTLNAVAFSAHWGILTGFLPFAEGAGFAVLWLGYGVIATIGAVLLRSRIRSKPGVASIGVRAERTVWIGAAMAVVAIALGSIGRMMLTGDDAAPNAIFGAAFALYGAALFATSKLSQQNWMTPFAWLSILAGGALSVFANYDWAYLVAAAASLAVLLAPGILLLRREPASIV